MDLAMLPKNLARRPQTPTFPPSASDTHPQSDIRELAPHTSEQDIDLQVQVSIGRMGTLRRRGCAIGQYILSPTPSAVELTVSIPLDGELVIATFTFNKSESLGALCSINHESPAALESARRAVDLVRRHDARLAAWLELVAG